MEDNVRDLVLAMKAIVEGEGPATWQERRDAVLSIVDLTGDRDAFDEFVSWFQETDSYQ